VAIVIVIGPVRRADRGYGSGIKEGTFDACKGVTVVAGEFVIRKLVFTIQDYFIRAEQRTSGL
jgi:hypothetical protein